MSDDDFDEEFARLTAGLSSDLEAPLKDTSELEPKRTSIGMVLAPVNDVAALGALLKLAGIDADVVKTDPWAAVWIPLDPADAPVDEELLLLTGQRPIPDVVDRVAKVVSTFTPYGAVVLISWLAEDESFESGITGNITAKRYVDGEPEETLESGILINQLDDIAEDLLLGRATPSDFPDDGSGWRKFFRRPGRRP